MKKIFSFALCIILIFSFAACKSDKKKTNDEIDLGYYANLGEIPEMKYKLGSDCDKAISVLQAEYDDYMNGGSTMPSDDDHDHDTEGVFFSSTEEDGLLHLNQGNKGYYCLADKKGDGITAIYTYDTAFGIETGTLAYDLKKKMESIEFEESEITDGCLFYADYMTEGTLLTAEFDDVTVQFAFQDGGLCCTAVFKTAAYK